MRINIHKLQKNIYATWVNKDTLYSLLFTLFIFFITYLAIFRGGVDYLDDIERGYTGKRGWQNFSRYTSNFLSAIFNMSDKLTDMSPVTQIIAVLFLSLSILILVKIFFAKYNYFALAAGTIVAINPFFLESI